MHHVIVTRVVWFVAALLAVACVLFALGVTP
jgi:hypothetical protein